MREQHLNLLSLASRSDIGLGGGDLARQVASAFMNAPWDLAGRCVRAASRFQLARAAIIGARPVEQRRTVVHQRPLRAQHLASGTEVRVALVIVAEVVTREGPIATLR